MRTGAVVLGVTLALSALVASCEEEPATPKRSSSSGDDGGSTTQEDSGSGGPKYILDDGSGTGEKWSEVYADLFGPSGKASCAGAGSACHGSDTATGAKASKFVCADESGCRESILSPDSRMVKDTDFDKPEQSLLVVILRKKRSDGSIGGTQPKSPLFVFHTNSLDRIKAWIKNGATAD